VTSVPPTNHLLAFTLASFALIVIPGPSVLFVISRSLVLGRRGGLLSVLGNELGVYAQVVAVAFGLGAVVASSAAVFTVVKLVGAAYIIFLGVQAIRHRRDFTAAVTQRHEARSSGRILWQGFVVGVANPKVVVFLAAVLPQFVDRSSGAVWLQLLVLGAIFTAVALISDTTWALAAGTARAWFTGSPRRLARLGCGGGLVMIGLGASVALTGRPD
jgi:threonine/homoserine/homoserine lactone efflux protein